jgi:GH15 family glucan-1,4-alpha-glucosidase
VSYHPIEDYGIIGDLHTVALVGKHGAIDWWCYPHFDSPSIFGAMLDDVKGGSFEIAPTVPCQTKQLYLPDTNVLITRFLCEDGVGEIVDFMPVKDRGAQEIAHTIIRRVEVVRGKLTFRVRCRPAFDYARASHTVEIHPHGALFASGNLRLGLRTGATLSADGDGAAVAEVTLDEKQRLTFELSQVTGAAVPPPSRDDVITAAYQDTAHYWRAWVSSGSYRGRWREMVSRSALALKLMTFQPTGSIVAAPTTSLPEGIGGVRNWDYRYTWIRDASFTLYGLLRVGYVEEAGHFMEWLAGRLKDVGPSGVLQIMYSIHGDAELPESTLDHLDGYRQSRPVRIGNGAAAQIQLDIYGELMDAVYLYNKHGKPISYDLWLSLSRMVDWVCENWQRPDNGIWEVRGGPQHFVYSKLMCWVALDRGIRLAGKRSFPAPVQRWTEVRDAIYQEVMTRGWNADLQSFVQAYDSDVLDASNLIMPLVFFLAPNDPRMTATIDATLASLVSDSLVSRYRTDAYDDGLPGDEGTFSMCTFWLVEALTRAGRVDEARVIFEKMLTYANHLGLYAEQIGRTGQALGNFPQAFTHLALISAAYNLNLALDHRPRR